MVEKKCVGEQCYSYKNGFCYVYDNQEPVKVQQDEECIIIEFAD